MKKNFKYYLHNIQHTIESCILCIRFPFLYPRNVLTNKHYNNWKLHRYHTDNWEKAYKINHTTYKWEVTDKWLAFKIKCADFLNNYVLQIFHFIPTYNLLDMMEDGWRKAFGIQMCKEIKKEILATGGIKYLLNYRINDIKEKWGELCWYSNTNTEEINRIIEKYCYISKNTCYICGKSADYITTGYILPYCKNCIPEEQKKYAKRMYYDVPFYGWTKFSSKTEDNESSEENPS